MGPKRNNWIAIRTAYVVKGWSAEKCSEEFGIHVTTIKKRASAEGWTQERHRNITDSHLAATTEAALVVQDAANYIKAEHAKAVSLLNGLLVGADEDIAASKPGRSRAETRRACFESFKIALGLQRTVLGLKDGQSSVMPDNNEDDGARRIIFDDSDDQKTA